MRFGWHWDGANWYWLGGANDGAMKTDWQKVNGKWYYMNGEGKMQTGWVTVRGKKYYLNGSGAMVSGWLKLGGSWYYFGGADDGAMKTGWQQVGGKWYYMYSDGKMAENTEVGGYWVDSSGAWVKSEQPSHWIKSGDRWWYRHMGGGYTTNGFETINGKKYYFDADGWMVSGWKLVDGDWYYFGDANDGSMKSNQKVGDYYVGSDGAMVAGESVGGIYYGASGKAEHTCNWVEKTETIEHEAETHEEIVKEAWTEYIEHPAETHQELVKEAWTETVEHPAETHQELVKEAWTETIEHPAETHQELVKEAWDEEVYVPGQGHYEIIEPEWVEEVPVYGYTICHLCNEDISKDVRNHVAVHVKDCVIYPFEDVEEEVYMGIGQVPVYESQEVVRCLVCREDITELVNEYGYDEACRIHEENAEDWTLELGHDIVTKMEDVIIGYEEGPVYETVYKTVCTICNEDAGDDWPAHVLGHISEGKIGEVTITDPDVQTGVKEVVHEAVKEWIPEYDIIHHEAEYKTVVDKEAWTETIEHEAEYKTVVDKEAWTETIEHEAEYKTVVDKEAWVETFVHQAEYETVVDKEAWTEIVKSTVCSKCGSEK